ncbi:putative lipase [Erysiphe neolycopersici]|uniref:sn-1-specific diacylglycerol lipase n=1 Tax=Erysiphe neolycopersici TaxID=212602 RepID=A0A420I4G4_9PEZI|nr:putative lipase [Erysiphe neolycopersici]
MELTKGENKARDLKMNPVENSSLTLLPLSVANVVSLVTRSSSLYLRVGTFIGRLTLYGAHHSTLTGLELSRAIMENILIQAGKHVSDRSTGGLGEAEGILERSLIILHSTITKISFAVSTGFYFSYATLDSACYVSRLLLGSLDSIFGSTDSSKAIASIIALIRREFQNPATGREGEKVGVADLLVGACGLALLQQWCSRITEAENNDCKVVWDVVVLNNGKRADVIINNGLALVKPEPIFFVPSSHGNDIIKPIEREDVNRYIEDDEMPEITLKERISKALPSNASVSVHTQTNVTKIITVIVTGAKPPNITLPPGIEMIEQEPYHLKNIEIEKDGLTIKQSVSHLTPMYRATYRVQMGPDNRDLGSGNPPGSLINDDLVDPNSELVLSCKFRPTSGRCIEKRRPKSFDSSREQFIFQNSADNLANQKRSRKPVITSASLNLGQTPRKSTAQPPTKPVKLENSLLTKAPEKKDWLKRNQLKGLTTTSINRDVETSFSPKQTSEFSSLDDITLTSSEDRQQVNPPRSSHNISPQGLRDPHFPRSMSGPCYYYTHSNNHDSVTPEQETSVSTSKYIDHWYAKGLLRAMSEKQLASTAMTPPLKNIFGNSIYFNQPSSIFSDLDGLSRTGFVADLFPEYHLVRNITRYVRFASASYGSHFLRLMGITTGDSGRDIDETHHHEHHSFSTHTQLPPSTIILSSFVDSQGGTDSTGHTNTGVPMVHFVSLDHDSKAVVLTCRGTLGFEDVLTDLTCDYDDIVYCGKAYEVHKGIHASARRLLDGGGGRVMATISAALVEFPDYGLVFCGHSLGGAVSALLAVMISEPNETSTAFFTKSLPPLLANGPSKIQTQLPKGRRVHVYTYGPPATMSSSLRMATRGLVTTIVNGQDLVPFLSLGVLHDLQAIALAFKTDDKGAKIEVIKRVLQGLTGKFSDSWNNRQRIISDDNDQWAYSTLKTLRACMLSTKLVPPGEIFVIETMAVLQRDGLIKRPLGRPATRVVVKYVKDVEKRFGEIQFGGSMLLDHSPGRYEASLDALGNGVLRN